MKMLISKPKKQASHYLFWTFFPMTFSHNFFWRQQPWMTFYVVFAFVFPCLFSTIHAIIHIMPIPTQYSHGHATFLFSPHFDTHFTTPSNASHQFLVNAMERYTSLFLNYSLIPWNGTIPIHETQGEIDLIHIHVLSASIDLDSDQLNEGYAMNITKQGISIQAETVFGAMHALTTFSHILESSPRSSTTPSTLFIPHMPWFIQDYPVYSHRGVLLDTARHFYPLQSILHTLDIMSWVKLNVLHWHIIDAHSFPLASHIYPQLAQWGAFSPQQTYSRETIAEIVQYAWYRGIKVIPEIDQPGHAFSWSGAFPELVLCPDIQPNYALYGPAPPTGQLSLVHPKTVTIVSDLFKEQSDWFTSRFIHTGGDEINEQCYWDDPPTRKYLQLNGITLQDLVRKHFLQVHDTLREKLKTPIIWEDAVLLYNVTSTDIVIQAWKSPESIVRLVRDYKLKTIASPMEYYYLDCGRGGYLNSPKGYDSHCGHLKTWQHIYTFNPRQGLTPEEQLLVLGGEVCVWSELVDPIVLDTVVWPRTAAAAEIWWSGHLDAQGTVRTTKEVLPRIIALRRLFVDRQVRADVVQMTWCEKNDGHCERYFPPVNNFFNAFGHDEL